MTAKTIQDKIENVQTKVVEPFVDKILGKIFSKKLIVFWVATWLVDQGKISVREWSVFAGLYVVGLIWINHLEKMEEKAKNKRSWFDKRGDKPIEMPKIPEED